MDDSPGCTRHEGLVRAPRLTALPTAPAGARYGRPGTRPASVIEPLLGGAQHVEHLVEMAVGASYLAPAPATPASPGGGQHGGQLCVVLLTPVCLTAAAVH